MLAAEMVTARDALEPLSAEWDALAVACGRPQMAPGFVLPWWRHVAPPDARPRLVAVREGDRLVGIAPFYVEPSARRTRIDYRLPGIELCAGIAPLAVRDCEWDVATAIGAELACAKPRPSLIALEGVPIASPWAIALRERWPGARRPTLRQYHLHGCPLVTLREASFDAWLAGKSSNFRGQMRRLRRGFAAAGGTTRLATDATLDEDVAAFARLHAQRWEGRGFRLRMLDLEGEPISAQLFLAAGETVLYLNGGWDKRHAKLKPSMLGLLDAIEETFATGERRIDLGVGDQAYKQRFANGNDPVGWSILMPPGPWRPLTRAHTAPMRVRYATRDVAKRALSDQQADRLRALRARWSST
jgi:CelD/BcsL family acetyltransferase involved in cellulose biosynthesis